MSDIDWNSRVNNVLSAFNGIEHFEVSGDLGNRPDSPCIGVCSTLYTEYCNGCGRNYLEVAKWVSMSQQEKAAIWNRIEKQGFPLNRE